MWWLRSRSYQQRINYDDVSQRRFEGEDSMNANSYITTDELIDRINQLPKVFAIRSDLYGIDIYADREEYRDDDKDCRWFMTADPKAKSIAQPFGDNFEGWPEEWLDPEFWDLK